MILISICYIVIQLVLDHSIQQYVMMILDIHAHMISLWEDKKFWVVHKEFMILKYFKKELFNVKLILVLSKIILTVSDMEHSHMEEEVLDWKELLCFIVLLKILEMLHCSQEILKESPLDLSMYTNNLRLIIVLKIYWKYFDNWLSYSLSEQSDQQLPSTWIKDINWI